jgi:hypothetical protein
VVNHRSVGTGPAGAGIETSQLDVGVTDEEDWSMADGGTTFVTIFCSGQLIKFDMAVNALKEAKIAHQILAETSTGLRVAMPVAPAQGPGRFFTLLVPTNAEAEAKLVLSELPFEITTNPGSWDFQPRPSIKRWWKVCIIVMLLLFVLIWIMELAGIK